MSSWVTTGHESRHWSTGGYSRLQERRKTRRKPTDRTRRNRPTSRSLCYTPSKVVFVATQVQKKARWVSLRDGRLFLHTLLERNGGPYVRFLWLSSHRRRGHNQSIRWEKPYRFLLRDLELVGSIFLP